MSDSEFNDNEEDVDDAFKDACVNPGEGTSRHISDNESDVGFED